MELVLRFEEDQIFYWAYQYVELQDDEEREKEKNLLNLKDDVQDYGYLTISQLWDLAYWKSHSKVDLTLDNDDSFVQEMTARAFESTDPWGKLMTLTGLKGIGLPTASAILHFFDEERYPILDIHALWSVGLEYKSRNSYPFWIQYTEFCRDIAKDNNAEMRDLDRALWKFSQTKTKEERTELDT